MIDIELLRNEATRKQTVDLLGKRGVALSDIDSLLSADASWRDAHEKLEGLLATKKQASDAIAKSSPEEKKKIIAEMQKLTNQEITVQQEEADAATRRETLWRKMPNIPFPDVQEGGETNSEVLAESTVRPRPQSETPLDYFALAKGGIDMQRGAKVSGARFTYLTGKVAQLEFAVISYVLAHLTKKGFVQVVPPLLLQHEAMSGMGYLDQAGDEVYKTQDDLYLIGTSEQSLGAMHMNELFSPEQLPLRYVAYSPCFRREAGSHGKDVKGILRLHQFDKVEMFSIVTPEASEQEHQALLAHQREIMDSLELPYRVVRLAAGDIGNPSAKTYDIETWIPSQQTYRETSSTSNTTDFQARRLGIRYKKDGKTHKVHMLNGTGAALSRLLIAILENHQQADGSVAIPKVLHPYLPFTNIS